VLGSARIPAKQTVIVFHEGLAWVAQIVMFLALGLLVFPSQLDDVWLEGTALALVLVFIARPLTAALATAFEPFTAGERVVLGWAGLRGAVPVVLATFPVIEGLDADKTFFNIIFFAVVISTLLQGGTVEWLAQKLGVTTSEPALPRPLMETGTVRRLGAEIVEYPVGTDDAIVGQLVRELGLPRDALLSVIVRGEEALLPRGSTRIEADDRLHVMVREEVAGEMPDLLERWRSGPVEIPAVRQAPLRAGTAVFTTRRWTHADGDAGFPKEVHGVPVANHLRTRRDQRGALVSLEDGRFAVTGPLVAIGGPLQVQRYARRQLTSEADAAARAWWQEVIGALAR
jgi:potassium/hydrogen antiporter